MSDMDEISYWVYTKRAPCLFNYDNELRKQNQEAHSSKQKPKSDTEKHQSPVKRKRKLSSLYEATIPPNVYFESSQQNIRHMPCNSKSETIISEVDFNIKNSSVQKKNKRPRVQKRTTLHKKNRILTSTPKVAAAIRRSLRKTQSNCLNDKPNESFSYHNPDVNYYANNNKIDATVTPVKSINKSKRVSNKLPHSDNQNAAIKNTAAGDTIHNDALGNGQFEDISDVSGFTANYIRSTKVHYSRNPRKLRSSASRLKNFTVTLCVNKAVNTGTGLNCSTDSSQNAVNMITTTKTSESHPKVNKGTSPLKFIDTRATKHKNNDSNNKLDSSKDVSNINASLQSRTSTSRYPKRHKNHSNKVLNISDVDINRRKVMKNSVLRNSHRKENPDETLLSRTRSGRSTGLTVRQPENSVLVVSNASSERAPTRPPRPSRAAARRSAELSRHEHRTDSLRDKSGFTACFSDSDNDSEPLKQRKFFC